MSIVERFLRYAFYTGLFVLALTLLFLSFSRYNNLIDASLEVVSGSKSINEQQVINTDNMVRKSQIISELMKSDIEYDYEIIEKNETIYISADQHDPERLSLYNLVSDTFERQYIYDQSGKTKKIVYKYTN